MVSKDQDKMGAMCSCFFRPFVFILDFLDDRVHNKAKALRNSYAVMFIMSVVFWLTSFRVMSECFYHPCIEGYVPLQKFLCATPHRLQRLL